MRFPRPIQRAFDLLAPELRRIADGLDILHKDAQQFREATNIASESDHQDRKIRREWDDKVLADNEKAEENRARRENRSYRAQDSIKWATWLTAIGAIFYGGVAAYQAHEMRIATEAANKSAETAARALNESKKANDSNSGDNQRAYELSRSALVTVQRAFVVPTPNFKPAFKPNTNEMLGIELQPAWINSGVTPTKNLTIHVSRDFFSTPDLPKGFTYPDMWDKGVPHVAGHFFLGPKDQANVAVINFPRPLVEEIADKKMFWYVWGWAKYNDIFPGTTPHITKFCWRIYFRREYQNPSGDESFITETPPCPKNNCYDEECGQ